MGNVLQHLTCLPSALGATYFGCAARNLEKGWDQISEVGNPTGIISTGDHFIFQLGLGNAWDFAWALDAWPGHEERYLLWDEKTGMAVLTMLTQEFSGEHPPTVRIRALLDEDDYQHVLKLLEDPDAD